MFCAKCGTKLPDEANYCWHCGEAQKDDIQVQESTFEICEIVYSVVEPAGLFSAGKGQFWARAIGPTGQHRAGETEVLPGNDPPARMMGRGGSGLVPNSKLW
ncbi:MAG: zinc ribbon domain-containing protein [Chloroflexi bacterium]|nr:zinc ribbon domain-containing protein [Chloroflexota bacterium]